MSILLYRLIYLSSSLFRVYYLHLPYTLYFCSVSGGFSLLSPRPRTTSISWTSVLVGPSGRSIEDGRPRGPRPWTVGYGGRRGTEKRVTMPSSDPLLFDSDCLEGTPSTSLAAGGRPKTPTNGTNFLFLFHLDFTGPCLGASCVSTGLECVRVFLRM